MRLHTVFVQLELIRLLRGCVTAWEKWLTAEHAGRIPFYERHMVRACRVALHAWSARL